MKIGYCKPYCKLCNLIGSFSPFNIINEITVYYCFICLKIYIRIICVSRFLNSIVIPAKYDAQVQSAFVWIVSILQLLLIVMIAVCKSLRLKAIENKNNIFFWQKNTSYNSKVKKKESVFLYRYNFNCLKFHTIF